MKIVEVLHIYSGRRTREQDILPGRYPADDPRLFGQAKYLVENGHAVYVGDEVLPDMPIDAKIVMLPGTGKPPVDDMIADLVEGDGIVISEVDEMNADELDDPDNPFPGSKPVSIDEAHEDFKKQQSAARSRKK